MPNVIMFGHSYESELDNDFWFVEARAVANCGPWRDEKADCDFVATRKDNEQRVHYVRLKTWDKRQKPPHEEFRKESMAF